MAINVTFVRVTMVAGVHKGVGTTADLEDGLAKLLVSKGDATFTTAPASAVNPGDIFATGIKAATSTATTLDIAVPGLKATDVVDVQLVGQGAAEVITKAVNDSANSKIVVTFSAAATATTTKVAWTVVRPRS